ncbi:bifunctional 4-hydroxy-2-oxoglutarate aldolase/2-dehydro-3-deoxy-phosphogluconate aldolase [Salinibacterium sp. G-O1]|uniref:bifunctional 4-hydroxy-2-oxoglutarate aldolase/2-dehydro-3-deoxy-phosphogluconate aldolase n=1 Tax=Salinibacterium sp. G-O1 TaxID=3046208 RepID=UPI0024BA5A73|nr:bifunctional 4-hydroxy-2-oxoglutarate aldolase/2-dehydro-3-deoxy-phosphogluconate aldolase [Salinibacterium sp. G-O1]MDJ0334053.1 bifunctional 4-hydroxy-2-oxoglutarate aldolase/2-dehydro-3-deoxy-phosphogluconate aldolase [Salinibacterium sp. G-O1]
MNDAFLTLAKLGVVPVVEIADASTAVALADALTAGGLPALEVTLRTPAALDAIRAIAEARPDVLVGAGTLLDAGMLDQAVAAGARFLVSPGLTPSLGDAARASGLPFIPGAVTASEAMAAIDAGFNVLKFFPAAASGGPAAISALAAPLGGAGVRFMPTGGIRANTLQDYLDIPAVIAVGGTWIADTASINSQDWDGITARARALTNNDHS